MNRQLGGVFITAIGMFGLAAISASAQPAPSPSPVSAPNKVMPPDAALTARFTAFFTDVLAGRVPSGNLIPQMKSGLTSTLLSQIDGYYANFGAFRSLQYVRQDTVQGYTRYHYTAIFDKSTQGLMFVIDSSGAIAGFFQDQASPQ